MLWVEILGEAGQGDSNFLVPWGKLDAVAQCNNVMFGITSNPPVLFTPVPYCLNSVFSYKGWRFYVKYYEMRIVPSKKKKELWNLGLRTQHKDRRILHQYITVSKWDPKECWAIIPANDCLIHNIQSGWMFALFPSDTYWGNEIHCTDCFSSRIFKGQRTVNIEKELFSLNSGTHENSHCYFCNNCTTDNLQSYCSIWHLSFVSTSYAEWFQVEAVLILWSQIPCEQVCLLFKTMYLGTAHKHCEKIDPLLGGLGICF